MLYSFIATVLAVLLAGLAGAAYAWRMAKTSTRQQMASAEATWQQRLQKESPGGSVLESFTTGWLNLILQALWTPVIEKHVAALTSNLLQKVFSEVREKNSHKSPWKYIESIVLEELSFGQCPPMFQGALAKYDPTTSLLNIGMDVRFHSNSAQAVLLVKSKALPLLAPVTARLEATYVQFKGRLNLGLLLGSEPPGISGIFYSFAGPPHLDLAVRPLGMPLPPEFDIGLAGALQGVLRRIISRRMVEPQRRYFDLNRMYMNKHIARVGGPGGLLRMTVQCGKHLLPYTADIAQQRRPQPDPTAPSAWAAADAATHSPGTSRRMSNLAAAIRATSHSSYCQVELGQQKLRTPVAHHSAAEDAVWNWELALALPAEPTVAASANGSVVCSLAVYDAQTVGEATPLGKCRVALNSLQLVPNGAARTVLLPLKGASSKQAAVQVSVAWLKSTRPQQQQQPPRSMGQPAPPQQLEQLHQQQQQQQHAPSHKRNNSDASAVSTLSVSVDAMPPSVASAAPSSVGSGASLPAHAASPGSTPPAASSSPSKAVSWRDEQQRLRQLRQVEAAGVALAAAAAAGSAAASSMPERRLSRSLAGSPVGLVESAAPGMSRASAHRRSITLDLATLGAVNDAVTATGAATGAGNTGRSTPVDTSMPATQEPAARALGAGVDLEKALQQHQQQQASMAGSWLWNSTSGWGSWLGLSASSPQLAVEAPAAAGGNAEPAAAAAADSVVAPVVAPADPANSSTTNNPLALLASAVQMQRQIQQQQQQLAMLQQQLTSLSSRHLQLQQEQRRNARAAIMQGARFLLHCQDGMVQQVLLYLRVSPAAGTGTAGSTAAQDASTGSSACSSRRSSIAGSQEQQPVQQHDLSRGCLVLAAVPASRDTAWQRFSSTGRLSFAGALSSRLHLPGGSTPPDSSAGGVLANGAQPAAAAAAVGSGGPISRRLARRQRKQLAKLAYEPIDYLRDALPELQVVALCSLVGVQQGMQLGAAVGLTKAAGSLISGALLDSGRAGGRTAAGPAAGQQQDSLTVLYQEAPGGVLGIRLQVPPVGNGRSRDEWVSALQQLVGNDLGAV